MPQSFEKYFSPQIGEIVQLRAEDLKIENEIHCFLITPAAGRLETSSAFRRVPLHSKLLEMGLLDFIGMKSGRIFLNDLTSHKATKWFTPFRKNIGIADESEFNETPLPNRYDDVLAQKLKDQAWATRQ